MRVGFVVGRFPALSETFVISQMAGLMQEGFKVGIVCDEVADDPNTGRAKPPLCNLMAHARHWWGPLGFLRDPVQRLPHRFRDKTSAGLDVLFADQLKKFDALIAHFGRSGARVARVKKRRSVTAPLITFFHGYDVGVPLKSGRLGDYRDLFERGDLCLTVNEFFRGKLSEAGAAPDRIAVHRMGIDLASFPFRRAPRTGEPIRFISVCRLTEKKGIEYSLRAFARLPADRPWRYTIIGDGALLPALRSLAGDLGIADRVTFLGSRPHDEVRAQLSRSHAFILPSITARNGDVEGVPVALMEAMASGLTVVSSYHSGIPELIDSGKTGLLSAEKDVAGLAEKIAHVIDHPDDCDRMAVLARQQIERNFNNRTLNSQLAARLHQLHASSAKQAA